MRGGCFRAVLAMEGVMDFCQGIDIGFDYTGFVDIIAAFFIEEYIGFSLACSEQVQGSLVL